ncbi:hypothetical protein [Galbibacter sp. PAP.153]|uniref:hypothetical protein n=1 Tax=Galbibacter sp. PAP.153 TaxID=3104623 RepID=UPI00300B9EC3
MDTGSQGSIELSEKTFTSLKQGNCINEIKGFHYGKKDHSATIVQLQDISIQEKSFGKQDNLYLESNKGNDEISLGYTFLRNYISTWNFKKKTIELIEEE